MAKCVGQGNNYCNNEVNDTDYPDDTMCDQCFSDLVSKLERKSNV
mgnify:CR=1 FL=1